MVVVNLQKTPYDRMSAVRVFARTDNFMRALMEALEIGDNFDRSFDAIYDWQKLEAQRAKDKKDKEKAKEKKKGGSSFFSFWSSSNE